MTNAESTIAQYRHAASVMGFDFGSQKMGMAIGQSVTGTASPLPLVAMKDGIPQWESLLAIVSQWQPALCVVGLPLNMDDSESELSLRARKFARRLRHFSQIPVVMVDERLTTREAREHLKHKEKTGKNRTAADSVAAMLLVESWFREMEGVLP